MESWFGCILLNRVFFKHLSVCGNGTFYHTLCFCTSLHHLMPLNSTQTPRHLLSHHCGKADGEFEQRVPCRPAAASCQSLVVWRSSVSIKIPIKAGNLNRVFF